ncbi:MAG: hypothetical protein R3D29_05470 [Nitratireductor sp.]
MADNSAILPDRFIVNKPWTIFSGNILDQDRNGSNFGGSTACLLFHEGLPSHEVIRFFCIDREAEASFEGRIAFTNVMAEMAEAFSRRQAFMANIPICRRPNGAPASMRAGKPLA